MVKSDRYCLVKCRMSLLLNDEFFDRFATREIRSILLFSRQKVDF